MEKALQAGTRLSPGLLKQVRVPGELGVKVPRLERGAGRTDNAHLLPAATVWCRRCVLYSDTTGSKNCLVPYRLLDLGQISQSL